MNENEKSILNKTMAELTLADHLKVTGTILIVTIGVPLVITGVASGVSKLRNRRQKPDITVVEENTETE